MQAIPTKPTLEETMEALKEIVIQADEDCPEEHRSEHFNEALQYAIEILERYCAATDGDAQ